MEERITIRIENMHPIEVSKGLPLFDIARETNYTDAVAAIVNNEVCDLNTKIKKSSDIKFLTFKDRKGLLIYTSGLKFLYIAAIKELFGEDTNVEIKHSIDKGLYTETSVELDEYKVSKIVSKMEELSRESLPIEKIQTTRREAINYFEKNEEEKALNLKIKTNELAVLYKLKDYYNYFYTVMPINTSVLKHFDVKLIDNHSAVLMLPRRNGEVEAYIDRPKVLKCFKDYEKWTEKLNVRYLSDINRIVINGRSKEFIELNELKQNEDLNEIANKIASNIDNIKLILLAGPTSSGKTTSAKKLALMLKSKGVNPFIISMDDYFKNRVDTPKDENGEYLFDSIEALDLDLFNEQLTKMLNNEEVIIPEYNFITGEKEYKRKPVSLKDRDCLIIEGIHTLNEIVTEKIPKENKLKIYISPFTPLAIDRHNHISTVDVRLIRRMVRDFRLRGRDALASLESWNQVRESEEKYIFPYQNEADIILNTALIYELGVLKTYVVPLLLKIDENSSYYSEATRIIKFLNNFLNIPPDYVPDTSVLKEFGGNGYFE